MGQWIQKTGLVVDGRGGKKKKKKDDDTQIVLGTQQQLSQTKSIAKTEDGTITDIISETT